MDLNTKKYTDFEEKKWNEYYDKALQDQDNERLMGLWWQIMDRDSIDIVKKYLPTNKKIKFIEAGCGSGIASFTLAKHLEDSQLVLCDISKNALKYSKTQEPDFLKSKVEYIQTEITHLPFENDNFDFTWNIGVIEHYSLEVIKMMINEMLRVTKKGGYVMVGIPNINSMAARKAWLLGTKFGRKYLKFISGYRFDTEIPYKNKQLQKYLAASTKKEVKIEFAGNCLWVNAPHFMVKVTDNYFLKSKYSFLTFFIIQK